MLRQLGILKLTTRTQSPRGKPLSEGQDQQQQARHRATRLQSMAERCRFRSRTRSWCSPPLSWLTDPVTRRILDKVKVWGVKCEQATSGRLDTLSMRFHWPLWCDSACVRGPKSLASNWPRPEAQRHALLMLFPCAARFCTLSEHIVFLTPPSCTTSVAVLESSAHVIETTSKLHYGCHDPSPGT